MLESFLPLYKSLSLLQGVDRLWLVLLLIPLCWLVRRPSGGTGAMAAE
jgi:hypothetical protein